MQFWILIYYEKRGYFIVLQCVNYIIGVLSPDAASFLWGG